MCNDVQPVHWYVLVGYIHFGEESAGKKTNEKDMLLLILPTLHVQYCGVTQNVLQKETGLQCGLDKKN